MVAADAAESARQVSPRAPRRVRWSLALGLLLLSPVCAEYLIGYDDSTGRPLQLLAGLLILGPLYGAPALLMREVARRWGIRWPGIVALALACGVLQAGVVDQSLFSDSYRDIDYWQDQTMPTWFAPWGLSGYNTVTFLTGHAVWSFSIPIALVESLSPPQARRPWLRWPGLVVVTGLYLAAAWLVWRDHQQTESDHASTGQVVGCLVVVALLVVFAVTVGRRTPTVAAERRVPRPLLVGAGSLLAATATHLLPSTWSGVAVTVVILGASALAVAYLSRSPRWSARYVVALATGPLVGNAVVGFLVTPLGEVSPLPKYAHNTVMVVGAVLLGLWAARRNQPRPAPPHGQVASQSQGEPQVWTTSKA